MSVRDASASTCQMCTPWARTAAVTASATPIHAPLENHEVNATATLSLLELARAAGVKRFANISSSEIYGTALGPRSAAQGS